MRFALNIKKAMRCMAVFAACSVAPLSSADAVDHSHTTSSMTFDQNLATPPVPNKTSRMVARQMEYGSQKLREKGLDTKTVRNGEVILVTIPAETFFLPNRTELIAESVRTLNLFKDIIDRPETYRLVVAVFADDTGDEAYSDSLTNERAMSLKNGFSKVASTDIVAPNIDYYWFGNTRFVVPNNTIANRAKNRRVEIYIIPENRLIDTARASK